MKFYIKNQHQQKGENNTYVSLFKEERTKKCSSLYLTSYVVTWQLKKKLFVLMWRSWNWNVIRNFFPCSSIDIRSSEKFLQKNNISLFHFRWHNTDSRDSKFIATDPTVIRASKRSKNSDISSNGAICRGWHQNQLVPGTTTTPDSRDNAVIKCAVKQFAGSNMHFLDTFQVLNYFVNDKKLLEFVIFIR